MPVRISLPQPRLALVIELYNEENEFIGRCLIRLARQTSVMTDKHHISKPLILWLIMKTATRTQVWPWPWPSPPHSHSHGHGHKLQTLTHYNKHWLVQYTKLCSLQALKCIGHKCTEAWLLSKYSCTSHVHVHVHVLQCLCKWSNSPYLCCFLCRWPSQYC